MPPTGKRRQGKVGEGIMILFNGPIEVGFRVMLLLHELYPEAADLNDLVMLDYAMVHSGDFPGGPPSIYAPSPLRTGEVAVRRQAIQDALHLFASRGLIVQRRSTSGILFAAADKSAILVEALSTESSLELRSVARWVIEQYVSAPDEGFREQFRDSLDRWRQEFLPVDIGEEDDHA